MCTLTTFTITTHTITHTITTHTINMHTITSNTTTRMRVQEDAHTHQHTTAKREQATAQSMAIVCRNAQTQ